MVFPFQAHSPTLSSHSNDYCRMLKANNKQTECFLSVSLCSTMQNTCYVTLNELGRAQYRAAPLGFIRNQQCFSQAITRPLFPHSSLGRHLSSQTAASISKSWNKADDRGRGAGLERVEGLRGRIIKEQISPRYQAGQRQRRMSGP